MELDSIVHCIATDKSNSNVGKKAEKHLISWKSWYKKIFHCSNNVVDYNVMPWYLWLGPKPGVGVLKLKYTPESIVEFIELKPIENNTLSF